MIRRVHAGKQQQVTQTEQRAAASFARQTDGLPRSPFPLPRPDAPRAVFDFEPLADPFRVSPALPQFVFTPLPQVLPAICPRKEAGKKPTLRARTALTEPLQTPRAARAGCRAGSVIENSLQLERSVQGAAVKQAAAASSLLSRTSWASLSAWSSDDGPPKHELQRDRPSYQLAILLALFPAWRFRLVFVLRVP